MRVIPRAAKSGLAGTRDGTLLVRLHAPPVDGAANAELIAVLATALGVPKRAITLVSGERSRQKRVRVSGLTPAEVAEVTEVAEKTGSHGATETDEES